MITVTIQWWQNLYAIWPLACHFTEWLQLTDKYMIFFFFLISLLIASEFNISIQQCFSFLRQSPPPRSPPGLCQCFSFWGLCPSDPLVWLCPWTQLGDFHPRPAHFLACCTTFKNVSPRLTLLVLSHSYLYNWHLFSLSCLLFSHLSVCYLNIVYLTFNLWCYQIQQSQDALIRVGGAPIALAAFFILWPWTGLEF